MADNILENILQKNKNPFTSPISDPSYEITKYIGDTLDINSPLPKTPSNSEKQASKGNDWLQNMHISANNLQKNLTSASQNSYNTYGVEFGYKGMNYERYYQGNNKLFKKLGFVPTRDNESLYKEHITVKEDLWRGVKGMANLAGVAYADSWSFGPKIDTSVSDAFEDTMNTYSSIKGGTTGFFTNNILNAGYTAGIIGQFITEEAITHAVTALATWGTGNVPMAAKTAVRGGMVVNKIVKSFKNSSKLLNTLDNFSDINKARTRWQRIGRNVVNFALPTETVRFAKNLDRLENFNGLQKTTLGFASFFRDIRGLRYAYGESALEGGSSYNELMARQISAFEENNNRPPNDAELSEMDSVAKKGGALTFSLNLPVIYYSNKIALGALFKAASPFKKLVLDNKLARVIDTKNKVGRLKVQEKSFGFKNINSVGRSLKAAPLNMARAIGAYTSANITEGLQEVYQEAVSSASNEYTDNIRKGNTLGSFYDYLATSAKEQISPQGLEVFASGFLMGGLVNVASAPISFATDKFGYVIDKEGYNNRRESELERLNKQVDIVNKYFESNPLDYFDPKRELFAKQNELSKKMEEAIEQGDEKTWMDLQDVSNFETFATALQMGVFDSFIEEVNQLRQLTQEEIASQYNVNPSDFNEYINKIEARANSIKNNYEDAKRNMPNPYNPFDIADKASDEYVSEMTNYLAHEEVVKRYVMARHSFERNLSRRESVKKSFQDTLGTAVSFTHVNPLFGRAAMETEIASLKATLDSFDGYTPSTEEARKMVKDKQAKVKSLENLALAIDDAVSIGSEESLLKAREALGEYVKAIGSETNSVIFESNIDDAFVQLMDFYKLNEESEFIANAVNQYLAPQYLQEATDAKANELRIEYENKREYIKVALEKFNKAKETNKFLQSIADAGVFFDVEQFADFEETGRMPDKLFAVGDNSEILANSPLYKSVIDRVRLFGVEVLNIPIPEAQNISNLGALKSEEDTRTLGDIEKQYGDGVQGVRDVLKKVINSDFADKKTKELAKRLLELTNGTQSLTFTSKGTENVIIKPDGNIEIDPRYNSYDYAGNNSSIEHAIVHSVLASRIQLIDDSVFYSEIDNVINAVREFLKDNNSPIAKAFPVALLNDKKSFAMAAMSNESVQALLAEIPYSTPNGEIALWDVFTQAITNWLKRVFGKNVSNTALNGAISATTKALENSNFSNVKVKVKSADGNVFMADGVITHYTDFGQVHYVKNANGEFEMVTIVETIPIAPTKFKAVDVTLSSATPIDVIKSGYPDLFQELITEYNNVYNSKISIDDAVENASFIDFVKENTIAADIISNYVNKNGLTTDSSIGPFENRKTAKIIAKLNQLGFTNDEIAGMNAADAYDIAYKNITKQQFEAQKNLVGNTIEELNIVAGKIFDKLDSSEDVSEGLIEEVEEFIGRADVIALVPDTAILMQEELNVALNRLNNKVEFNEVNIGDSLIDKEGRTVIVTSKKGGIIIAEDLENSDDIYTFDESNFNREIMGKHNKKEQKVTELNNKESEELLNNSLDLISDLEFIDAAVAADNTESEESAWNLFLSKVNNCK